MKRRNFIKVISTGVVVSFLPSIALSKGGIWEEDPQNVKELYECINKYCDVLMHSKKAYEEFYLDGEYKRFTHVVYALGTFSYAAEPRLCQSLWATMRTKILKNARQRPYLVWRRLPEYRTENAPYSTSSEDVVAMRLSMLDDFHQSEYMKPQGDPVKILSREEIEDRL